MALEPNDYIQRQGNKGLHKVMFQNVNGLNIDHIRQIFSAYGRISDVRATGNETGYRFVVFENYEGALRALKALYENESFAFKIPKDNHKSENLSSKPGWKHDNTNIQRNNANFNNKTKAKDVCVNENPKYNGLIWNYQVNNNIQGNSIQPNQALFNISKKISDSIPVSAVTNENKKEEKPLDVVSNTSKESKNFKIVDAQLVVVGNIPHKYGEAYIMHLLESFEPCAISKIEVLPNTNMRYCNVYLKSIEDSIKVELNYDKYNLDGQKLIVLRHSELWEQAQSSSA